MLKKENRQNAQGRCETTGKVLSLMGITRVHKRATCYRRGDVNCKPAKRFAEVTDPYIVMLSATSTPTTLCLWSTPGNSLEYAVTKNASASPLQFAHTKSLDLKLLRMNTCIECGGFPLLAFERLRPGGREAKRRGRKGGKGDGGSKDPRELSTRKTAQCRARRCLPAERGMDKTSQQNSFFAGICGISYTGSGL